MKTKTKKKIVFVLNKKEAKAVMTLIGGISDSDRKTLYGCTEKQSYLCEKVYDGLEKGLRQ